MDHQKVELEKLWQSGCCLQAEKDWLLKLHNSDVSLYNWLEKIYMDRIETWKHKSSNLDPRVKEVRTLEAELPTVEVKLYIQD